MEKADEIYVFPASFGWSDLGTWGSLHENSKRDAHNNVCIGSNIKMYESRNCIVHTTQEKKVVVQGLDGYIVAEKDNTFAGMPLDGRTANQGFFCGIRK